MCPPGSLNGNRLFGVICNFLFVEPGFALTPGTHLLGIPPARIKPPPPMVERRVSSVRWVKVLVMVVDVSVGVGVGGVVGVGG